MSEEASTSAVAKSSNPDSVLDPDSVLVDGKESWYFAPWNEDSCGEAMKNIADAFNLFAQTVTVNAPQLSDNDIVTLDTENSKVSGIFWKNVLSVVKDKKFHEHLIYVKNKKGKQPKVMFLLKIWFLFKV